MATVIYKLDDNVSTDVIYPGRFMATVLPAETPQFAFADDPEFTAKLKTRQYVAEKVIIAGKNFGCGSSREQAVSCLKGYELIIVAKSFARIFLQNAINLGLRLVISPAIDANEGDELRFQERYIVNLSTGKKFLFELMPKSRQAVIDAGGLIPYTRKRLEIMAR